MIAPLRKTWPDGRPYTRFPDYELLLVQLDAIPVADLIDRCKLPKSDPGYVPTECLLHFVRRSWASDDRAVWEPLLKILTERIRRTLPKGISPDGKSQSLATSQASEEVYDKFIVMLLGEKNAYNERLDFFEIRFNRGLAMLNASARIKAKKQEDRSETLFSEEDEGELASEVEVAAGSYDPFDPELVDQSIYRSRLVAAMNRLTLLERRVVEMCRQDVPIDSKDPESMTMVKILGRSDKGIRNIRDRAFAKLRALLTRGDL